MKDKYLKAWLGFLILGYASFFMLFWQLPDERFHIYFLDVGQGDAILIKTPDNSQILVDGGRGGKVIEELGEVMPFFDRSLDMVVATHPDADHIGGLPAVMKKYDVGGFLYNGVRAPKSDYTELLKDVNEERMPVFIAEKSTDFQFGDVFFDVIFPLESVEGESVDNTNDTSVSLRVTYDGHSILLTGDLEEVMEHELVKSGQNLRAEIYKAGHHGSKTSSSPEFLAKVRPEIAVISAGKDNSYGHPHPETLRNLYRAGVREIRRTDTEGRIEFVF
ncbi:MAG: ComEC/Rec2 family competence protein [Candidatus Gracilibacteria bacterium]